jgi:hypothetical protein
VTRGEWTILKWMLREIGWDGMDWIELAQDSNKWRPLVKMVMNLRVPQNVGKFLSNCTMAASQKVLSSLRK